LNFFHHLSELSQSPHQECSLAFVIFFNEKKQFVIKTQQQQQQQQTSSLSWQSTKANSSWGATV
jgi:hypothetical protein